MNRVHPDALTAILGVMILLGVIAAILVVVNPVR